MSRHARLAVSASLAVALSAGVLVALLVGIAIARTFVLQDAKTATVTSTHGSATEGIVVNAKGRAVYELSGDSEHHAKCTKAGGCWTFWPPVTAGSRKPQAGPGVKGRLAVWRHDGIAQLVLGGHPLYTFGGDSRADDATGQDVTSFGGTWHVVATSVAHSVNTTPSAPTDATPTSTTSTTPTTSTPTPVKPPTVTTPGTPTTPTW